MGCVLFYLQDEDSLQPNCCGGSKFYPRPKYIKIYNNNKGLLEGKNFGAITQYLRATVNDMQIIDTSDNTKLAYIGGEFSSNDLKRKLRKWEGIKNRIIENVGLMIILAIILLTFK